MSNRHEIIEKECWINLKILFSTKLYLFFGVYIWNFIIFAMQNKWENLRVFMEYPAMHERKFNLFYSGKLGDHFVEICAKYLKLFFEVFLGWVIRNGNFYHVNVGFILVIYAFC